ncbi:hypothetical protein EA472_03785 [Natrarchaeobius oligotrophus]|uniref:Uncharacterized protein n=1 Tax=Natrarchaeobius chitinivorans TaxID=1679083 RepID=A0A3N6MWR1_NATCH|nr:hypothetical protein EA472_03785 [Natrarchaeobius chitinivorans]
METLDTGDETVTRAARTDDSKMTASFTDSSSEFQGGKTCSRDVGARGWTSRKIESTDATNPLFERLPRGTRVGNGNFRGPSNSRRTWIRGSPSVTRTNRSARWVEYDPFYPSRHHRTRVRDAEWRRQR